MDDKTFELKNCSNDDVIILDNDSTYKISNFKPKIFSITTEYQRSYAIKKIRFFEIDIPEKAYFLEGQDCEILKPGSQGWQKGKLRLKLTLEFCPDEPEEIDQVENQELSPLDDLREKLNLESE